MPSDRQPGADPAECRGCNQRDGGLGEVKARCDGWQPDGYQCRPQPTGEQRKSGGHRDDREAAGQHALQSAEIQERSSQPRLGCAKKVPYFKPSKELRDLVNPGEAAKAS